MQPRHQGTDCFKLSGKRLLLFLQQRHAVLRKEFCGDIRAEKRLNALLIEADHLLTTLNLPLLRLILLRAECAAVFLDIVAAGAELLLELPAVRCHFIALCLNLRDLLFEPLQLQRRCPGGDLFILECSGEGIVLLLHVRALLLRRCEIGFQRFQLLLKPDDIAVAEHLLLFVDLADETLLARAELPDALLDQFEGLLLFGDCALERRDLFIGLAAALSDLIELALLLRKAREAE